MVSSIQQPLVSIAMTVFNAEPFLAKTLCSLLDQDYKNFELVISDNASEDRSGEICQEFAKRDMRIHYYRNSINMGPARNSYKAIDLCSGEFILTAADHDVYHPTFISSLLQVLQQDESVVLAYPRTVYIDENDQTIELMPDNIDTRGLDACQRFSKVIWEFGWMNMVYGLYRSAVFKTVWHSYQTIGPDHIIIANLCLHGSIAQLDEPLFFRRRNRPSETYQECTRRQIDLFCSSNYENLIPWTRMAYEHIKVITESSLGDEEKERLFDEVRKCFPTRFGPHMQNEVMQLLTEGSKILLNAQKFPNSYDVINSEISRVAQICRFFYPDMEGLDKLAANNVFSQADVKNSTPIQSNPSGLLNTKQTESVSVVIPTHNRAYILPRAVMSVLGQTYPIHEIVIVDDGSSDDTDSIILPLQRQYPQVKYFKIPKSGAQAARNEGIRQSTGTWVAFLDSDDEYLPRKIEKQMDVAIHEKVSVVHCECYIKRGDQLPVIFGTPAISGNIYQAVLSSPGPTFPALLARKTALEAMGLLDQLVPSFQEWDTVICLAKDNAFGYVPEPLYVYYCHDGETISKDMKRHVQGYAYIVEKHTINMLKYGGPGVLADHYRTLIQQALDYDLTGILQIYKHKFKALNSVDYRCSEANCKNKANGAARVEIANENIQSNTAVLGYISAIETVSAAEREGLSVCNYVEKLWGQQGDTQRVIDQMSSCGVFDIKAPNVLEIGTGTGRYLEKVLEKCKPALYESYETSEGWAEWLQSSYPIISHKADGVTLNQTATHSVDILHSHGVFVYLPFLVSYRYWKEIWRVVKSGGFVVFDIYSEGCADELAVEQWHLAQHNYPCFISRDYVVSLFAKYGFTLLKTFKNRYGASHSEYLVFVRNKS